MLDGDLDQLLLLTAEEIPDRILRGVLERLDAFRLIAELDVKSLDRFVVTLKAYQ